MHLDDLDTPFLAVDLDLLDANIARMKAAIVDRGGVAWRPHVKAIKTPAIAHRLVAAGAIGVTCAKLGEAEVMAHAGIRSILLANQVTSPRKLDRLANLNRQAEVIVAVDAAANAAMLGEAAVAAGAIVPVVIEVNTGMDRAGVEPGRPVVELAARIAAQPGLRLRGVMGWEGHTTSISDAAAKEAAVRRAVGALTASAALCREAGHGVDIVSCGGTGTYWISAGLRGVTEIQAGGGIFGDLRYRLEYGVDHPYALIAWSTVVSRPNARRIVCDAGWKAIGRFPVVPLPLGIAGVANVRMSAEHTTLDLSEDAAAPAIGARIPFVPGYSDATVFLHDHLHGVRGGRVEATWPLLARGKLA